jgi:hypothetical protein
MRFRLAMKATIFLMKEDGDIKSQEKAWDRIPRAAFRGEHEPGSSVFRPIARAEADLAALRWSGRCDEFPNCFEDDFELRVVLAFHGIQLPTQFFILAEHSAHPDERTHDLDVDLNGPRAVENAREHGNAMFGESVGRVAAPAPLT